MNRRHRLIIGILISLLFLYLAVRNLQWDELWQLFRQARYVYLLPALLLLVLINWTRAYRWRLLMYPDTHLALARVYRFVNIGYFFNNILPAKAGEVVRAYLVGRLIEGGIGQALSTLLIERLLDVLTVVLLLVTLIPFVELPAWAVRGGLLFGMGAIAGTTVLIVLSRFGDRGVNWVWRIIGRIPIVGHAKLKTALQNLVNGFGVLTRGQLLPGIAASSVLIWLGYATFNYTLMAAFRMTYLPFTAAALVLCATGFSMVIPSSPGAMGVFEWAAVQALAVYGVAESPAFGYALGLHVYTNIALIVFGLVGFAREGLSYAQIRSQVTASSKESTELR
ncbi:MAG: flippase-like domain-containing protein [Anaerolineae bacterium]|nr:flippase-like domain-containing protein [Anaerolineae bacterium]